ncbi:MAG: GNAT family N-acetyltransferase [Clostridia bacterium]|nr:GNAT family N-acetyltransferase [Clostridia bacterium]
MNITLGERTAETVAIYFDKAQHPAIRRMLPQKARTVEEALADYERTLQAGASSYGRTICADGRYVGDVWCFAIDLADTPSAMLSYCIFEQDIWGFGAATEAVRLFLEAVQAKFDLSSMGAFTYADNAASIRVLEKNGFTLQETFEENGRSSCYYERRLQSKGG